jgi:CCR4-NOT complex subunit CAF16
MANDAQAVSIASIQQCDDVDDNAVVVKNLTFAFPTSDTIVEDLSLELPKGSRAILCGANGAGKTTLLQILGGKYMVGQDTVRLLGRPAFHDLQLVSSGTSHSWDPPGAGTSRLRAKTWRSRATYRPER